MRTTDCLEPLPYDHPAYLLQERFEFLGNLYPGKSGCGEIHKVRKMETGELFALKIPRPKSETQRAEDADQAKAMLLREAKALNALSHRNIVKMREDQSQNGESLPYLLLEYVPGPNLGDFLRRDVDPLTRLRLATGVLSAITYMQGENWQHNDCHPGNVVVDENARWPVLIDFGLAVPVRQLHTLQPGVGVDGFTHPNVRDKKPYSPLTEKYQIVQITMYILGMEDSHPCASDWPGILSEMLEPFRDGDSSLNDRLEELDPRALLDALSCAMLQQLIRS
jgi:serine/threonine protein kinase